MERARMPLSSEKRMPSRISTPSDCRSTRAALSNARRRRPAGLAVRYADHRQLIDQAFTDCKGTCEGVRNDYFALLYPHARVRRAAARSGRAASPSAGTTMAGQAGFYFDKASETFTCFERQVRAIVHQQFNGRCQRPIDAGDAWYVFDASGQDKQQNQLLQQIEERACRNPWSSTTDIRSIFVF